MTETRKTTQKPPDIAELAREAATLRAELERAALDGSLDLKDKHAKAHQRLDELERVIHVARRLPTAEKS
jgi:hypothetical protein